MSGGVFIRPVRDDEARAYLDLLLALDRESDTMMLEPEERSQDPRAALMQIVELRQQGGMIFVAEVEGALVGFLAAERGMFRRNRHTATIAVGIRRDYRGMGVGTELFRMMERWSADRGITRLELTVMTHNQAGIKLYEKMGFKKEGLRRDSLVIRGEAVDEWLMAKILHRKP